MRLSEAIRLGAMLKPQGRGAFYERGHTCALGAALDAIGALNTASWANNYAPLGTAWPETEVFVTHPMSDARVQLWRAIEDLNDCYQWPREQIAAWVESIERAQDAAQPSVVTDRPVTV